MPRLDIRRARRLSAHEIGDEPVRIGRSSQNDLVLRNIHVSRHHCVIERVDGQLRLRDLDSQSGTFLNGEKISVSALFAGDRVSIGPFDLVVRTGPGEAELITRNAALDAALSHVHIDEDTGIPIEGPAALVATLRKELEAERAQYAQAAAQIAQLHHRLEEAETQPREDRTAISPDEDDERVSRLTDELAAANARIAEARTQLTESRQASEDAAAAASLRAVQLQESLDTERGRAEAAESRAASLTAQIEALRQADQGEDPSADLQRLLDGERDRFDAAAAEAASVQAELQASLQDFRELREVDLRALAGARAEAENHRRLLLEAQALGETAATDRRAALRQLHDAETELSRWRERGEEAERSLETERAHAADLNRALEEAWRKIEDADEQVRSLTTRIEELEASTAQQATQASAALAERTSEVERLATRETELSQRAEQATAENQTLLETVADLRAKLETADSSLHHALARADELEGAATDTQARIEAIENEARLQADAQTAAIAERDRQLAELQTSEEGHRQRLQNLEATKYAASEKAERALRTLNLLHGQIRSLDDAAARVNDLQGRLAHIEEAWVAADDSLDAVDENDQEQLEAAVQQRQRIVAELDALAKARDAAVASLRESAMRLRSLAEREAPAVTTVAPTAPAEPAGNNSGRKWWKLR